MGLNAGLNIGNSSNYGIGTSAYSSAPSTTSSLGAYNTSSYGTSNLGTSSLGTGSLFSSSVLNGYGSTTDYSNDIMFPAELAMNYNQIMAQSTTPAASQQQTQTQAQPQAQTAFTGGAYQTPTQEQAQVQTAVQSPALTDADVQAQAQLEYLQAQNPNIRITQNGNLYTETNAGKKTGVLVGIIAPVVKELSQALKGGTFSKAALNLKSLALKVPAFAIIGWGIGALADKFFNTQKAKAADAQASVQKQTGISLTA